MYFTASELSKLADEGKFVGTFIGRHGQNFDLYKNPQPAIWSVGKIDDQRKQDFPTLRSTQKTFTISGRHIKQDDSLIVDGKKVEGSIKLQDGEKILVSFSSLPNPGVHLFQIQEKDGRMSNEFIFYVR